MAVSLDHAVVKRPASLRGTEAAVPLDRTINISPLSRTYAVNQSIFLVIVSVPNVLAMAPRVCVKVMGVVENPE